MVKKQLNEKGSFFLVEVKVSNKKELWKANFLNGAVGIIQGNSSHQAEIEGIPKNWMNIVRALL